MIRFPWRSKLAAVVILFVLGTMAGQLRGVLDAVVGRVEEGARLTHDLRSTVTTLGDVVDVTSLRAEIAELRARLEEDGATPTELVELERVVARLEVLEVDPGPPGPPGPAGDPGPPGPAASTTTTTGRPGTTTTRPPAPTTTTTTPRPTTTTTRCALAVGRLLKAVCA